MAIRSEPYYWLTCDHPGCGVKSTEGGEFTAWADIVGAVEDAFNSDWTVTFDGKHYCDEHHPEEEDDDG